VPYVVRKKNYLDQFVQDNGGFGDLQTAYVYTSLEMVDEEGAIDRRTEEVVEIKFTVVEPKP